MRKGMRLLVSLFLALVFGWILPAQAEEFETPVNRSILEILPPEQVSGPHYRIRETVFADGYMDSFTVDSDFGVFEVTGDGALRKLLKEIQAIAVLQKVKKGKVYLEAVAKSGLMPVEFGKNLITDPVDTLTGIPKGVGRLFANIYAGLSTKRDPSEDSRIAAALSVSSYKREWAYQLGVDVYSSNKVLQKELNSVGWAGAAGSLTVSAALMPFGGPAAMAVSYTRLAQQFGNLLKDNPPPALRRMNEEKLLAMGVPEELARQFLNHPAFTPRHDTIIVGSLESLGQARGREAFVQFALKADDEQTANFMMDMAQTMRGYHETVSPIQEILLQSGLILCRAASGNTLVPFPLDHGVWTRRADTILRHFLSQGDLIDRQGKIEFWVTGTLSSLAKKRLGEFGVLVEEHVDQRIEFVD